MFNDGACSIVYDFYLSTYSCTQFAYNFNTCMNLQSYACKFRNSACISALESEDCIALST